MRASVERQGWTLLGEDDDEDEEQR
jgi:hypothetical protein